MMSDLKNENFIKKTVSVHGYKYNYSQICYVNSKIKIKIICKEHGIFEQIPNSHLKGRGCPKCGKITKKIKQTYTNEIFISKANEKHDFRYDYSLVEYESKDQKVKIICKEHGLFLQTPHRHINSVTGCTQCGISQKRITKSRTISDFLKRANNVHKNIYDYSETVYHNDKSKVNITCKKHGSFSVSPNNHLFKKSGCPKCNSIISKPEIEVQDFVKSLGIEIITNNRKILKGKELDIYIPNLNKAIEFNGLYWHYSDKYFKPGKHAMKSNLCRAQGIKLLHIREDLWLNKKEKIKETLIKFLKYNGITKR